MAMSAFLDSAGFKTRLITPNYDKSFFYLRGLFKSRTCLLQLQLKLTEALMSAIKIDRIFEPHYANKVINSEIAPSSYVLSINSFSS